MASRATYTVSGDVPEQTSWQLRTVLRDHEGNLIPRAAMTTLELTLYVQTSGNPLINSVDHVNILNADRGVVGATDGTVTITLHKADGVILNDTVASEKHVALVECTYNGGLDSVKREVVFTVKNMTRVS